MEQPKKRTIKSSENIVWKNNIKGVKTGQKLARLIFFLIAGINIVVATAMFVYSRVLSEENAIEAIMRQSLSYVALVTIILGAVFICLALFLKKYPRFIIWTGILIVFLKLAYSLYLNTYSFTVEPMLDVVLLIGLVYALKSYYKLQVSLQTKD